MRVGPGKETAQARNSRGWFTASELRRREQAWADTLELTVTCGLCGGFRFTGPAADARGRFLEHRTREHPETFRRRRRR